MKLHVAWIEGRQFEVEVVDSGRRLSIDGQERPCDWVRLPDGRYSIILDGRVYDLWVDASNGGYRVEGAADSLNLRVIDPRRLAGLSGADHGQSGLQRIRADMPGKVVRVLVSPGDEVAYDQGLLVLEAMKMQNEIRSPKAGVVKEIAVESGKAVNTGDFLLSLE
jgi:biotin carboxyl carrier protein